MIMVASTAVQSVQPSPVDLGALKTRQQGAWSSGDYAVVGTTLQIVGEELCEALDLHAGQKVLDVAAGNGNATLAAARRWCEVVSTDYVPSLLERGRLRAAADGLSIEFKEADAEALPFADSSFDVVVSTFGVMFTPDQDKAAAELLGSAGAAARSASPTGRRRVLSGSCSRRSENTCRRGRGEIAGIVGHPDADCGNVRAFSAGDQRRAAQLRVPLPLARALPGDLQELLRADAQGLRRARRRQPAGD
jgi:SAM-dependent methyltransferase